MPAIPRHELNRRGQEQGLAFCFCCFDRFNHAQPHNVPLGPNEGTAAALCEPCHAGMTPEQRLPYYQQLGRLWLSTVPEDDVRTHGRAAALVAAVKEGK